MVGQQEFVLALDIGSSSVRAGLFDRTGRLVEGTGQRVPYRLETGPDGRAELDPQLLCERIELLLDRVHATAPAPVCAVGISCFWHSLVGLNGQGEPTTPVTMWADTRAREVAARLRSAFDAMAHHRRTGGYLHPSYPAARLVWYRSLGSPEWRSSTYWCSFPDYLFRRWTGALVTSISMASGTGLFDTWRLAWDAETCRVIGIETEQLPVVTDVGQQLRGRYTKRWPKLAAAVWYPAWGDGACSNVGSGAVGGDRVTVMIGTSAAVRVLWKGVPVSVPWGLWLYRLDGDHVLAGGALSEGGNLIDWIRQRFALPPEEELWERISKVANGAEGVRWLPTIAGERSLRWPVDAVATLTGLRLGHDGVVILRAALEAVACRLADVLDALMAIRPEIGTVIASGNALQGTPGWLQIVADALGKTLLVAPDPEASLRGAALVTLARVGDQPLENLARAEIAEWARVVPRPDVTVRYRRIRAELRALAEGLERAVGAEGS